jgi:hypothetical protein
LYLDFGIAEVFQKKLNFIMCREASVYVLIPKQLDRLVEVFEGYLGEYRCIKYDSLDFISFAAANLHPEAGSIVALLSNMDDLKDGLIGINHPNLTNLDYLGSDVVHAKSINFSFSVYEAI